MALPHHPFNFVRTSYTVTRDGPRVDVNRSEDSQKIHQNASRTDAYSTSSNELNHSQMLSAHAFRDSGRISTSCDNKVLPKPSELKPRQLKRKRKQEAPVVLDHLAQLRRKQHGFETGEFNRHHGDFFGGCQPSQTSTGEDLDVQAVPCSPNLKRVRPAGSVYDAVETANSGYRSFSMGEPSKFSLPAAAMEFSTTPTQQSSSSSSKPTSEFQPLTSIYSGIHFSGTEQVPRGYSNEPLYSASTFSTGSKSDSTRFVLKTAPVEMDCTTARSMNVSVQDVFVTSVEQPHCSYSRPHQLWSRHQRLDDCIVPLSSSADTGHASRVTEKSCNSLSSAISESGAVFPTLLAPSQTPLTWSSDEDVPVPPPSLASLPTAQAFLRNPPFPLPTARLPAPATATASMVARLMPEHEMEVGRVAASQHPISTTAAPLQMQSIPSSTLHSPQMAVRRPLLNDSLEDFRLNFSESVPTSGATRPTSCLTDEESPLIPWEE